MKLNFTFTFETLFKSSVFVTATSTALHTYELAEVNFEFFLCKRITVFYKVTFNLIQSL